MQSRLKLSSLFGMKDLGKNVAGQRDFVFAVAEQSAVTCRWFVWKRLVGQRFIRNCSAITIDMLTDGSLMIRLAEAAEQRFVLHLLSVQQ